MWMSFANYNSQISQTLRSFEDYTVSGQMLRMLTTTCCPWHGPGPPPREQTTLGDSCTWIPPATNPGPGSQNTTKLGFVLLVSAVTGNTCSRSDVAGGVYHMMHHGLGQSSLRTVLDNKRLGAEGFGSVYLVDNGIWASSPAANS
jgi:hypothetical protein